MCTTLAVDGMVLPHHLVRRSALFNETSLSRSKTFSPPDHLAPTPGVPSLPFTHQPFAGDTDRFDGIRTMSTGFFEASKTMEPALKKRDTGELRVRDCTRIASRLGNVGQSQ